MTPDDAQEREKFLKAQAAIVAKINAPDGAEDVYKRQLFQLIKTKLESVEM